MYLSRKCPALLESNVLVSNDTKPQKFPTTIDNGVAGFGLGSSFLAYW